MAIYSSPSAQGIGESQAFLHFQSQVAKAAVIDRPILIIGERGTGKELAARRVHYMSSRWDKPLVTMNCASLPATLIESELFGYEKGAFTGATTSRKGRFEEADGGTLFLDEIGLIPLSVQEKLLRVVEYGTFERVGSSETRSVDVRIVGATNADLKKMSEEGKFKEDLLDRLSFEVLFVPPLRLRGNDILLLAENFAARMAGECNLDVFPIFSEEAKRKLLSYPWPGNVRELKNTVERAVYKSEGGIIEDLTFDPFSNPFAVKEEEKEESCFSSYSLSELEKAHQDLDLDFLKRALSLSGGNQKKASEELGMSYDQFRGLYRKYKGLLELN